MKKGVSILIIGAILIIAAVGIYAVLASNVNLKPMEIPGNSEKNINYTLTKDNYTLMIQTSGKIHYTLLNSTNIIAQGNVSNHIVKKVGVLKGSYTLRLKNLGNGSAELAVSLQSEKSLMSLGIQVLGSGGVCLIGIIMVIIGVWFIIREKRKTGENHVS